MVEALQTERCNLTCSNVPTQMYHASVAVNGTTVYAIACTTPIDENENNVFSFDAINDHWSTLPPPGHQRGILCIVNDMLCIFCGEDPNSDQVLKKVSMYNSDLEHWSDDYGDMIHARYLPGVVTYGDHVIFMGGDGQTEHLGSIEVMNWKKQLPWRESSVNLPIPMWNIKSTISGEHLVIVGYDHARGRGKKTFQISVTTIVQSLPEVSHWQCFASSSISEFCNSSLLKSSFDHWWCQSLLSRWHSYCRY